MLKGDTKKVQTTLATYCRTGEEVIVKGAKTERLPHYRRLVYNVVTGFLDQAYPITRQHLSDSEWEGLCNVFFRQHKCQPAEAWRIPYELVVFVDNNDHKLKSKFPFLPELLYFEWLEIDIYNQIDKPAIKLDNKALLNPQFVIEQFTYPVHKPLSNNASKGEYFILIYRHPTELNARFVELAPLSAFLLESISSSKSIQKSILELATALQIEDTKTVEQQANQFLALLEEKGMIISD